MADESRPDPVQETSVNLVVKKEPVSDDEKEPEPITADKIVPSPVNTENAEMHVKNEPKESDEMILDEAVSNKIKLTVKTTKEKQTVEVDKDVTVKDLKDEISKAYKTPVDQICLIFAGKILKDPETLESNDITDGLILHMVIRSPPKVSDTSQLSDGMIRASPFGLSSLGGIPGLASMGFGSPSFVELQQQMQRELMNNPELLQQVIDNSFVQSLMSNPTCMRQIIQANPEMRQMMEKNPDIGQLLDNEDLLKQSMDLAKNPTLLQALMHPFDGSTASGGSNENDSGSVSSKENVAIPNPWGSTPMETQPTQSSTTESTTEQADSLKAEGNGPTPVPGGLFTSPAMQSMFQQVQQNPRLMTEMMNAPYMGTVMEALSTNPDMASQVLMNNPVFSSEALSNQGAYKQAFPIFMQQMMNPEYRSFMSNPDNINAIMNIHQGLDTLQQAAPNLFNMFPGQPPYLLNPVAAASDNKGQQQSDPKSATEPNPDAFSQLMGYMVNCMTNHNVQLPPEERYQGELQQLDSMGFKNKDTNLLALMATFGDVNAAIKRMLPPQE